MHFNSQIRKTSVVALLVLSMFGFGMQDLKSATKAGCQCSMNSVEGSSNWIDTRSCCSEKANLASPCCCNPDAKVCQCGDCRCGEEESPSQPLPAIPTNEINEVVSPTLICSAIELGFPNPGELKKLSLPKPFSAHAARSSKQICVLLSRFTC